MRSVDLRLKTITYSLHIDDVGWILRIELDLSTQVPSVRPQALELVNVLKSLDVFQELAIVLVFCN